MPLTFARLFPDIRDGSPASYTLREIEKALTLEGYQVSYDQISEAQRELSRRPSTRELVTPQEIEGQRAYEFSWQAACAIARQATRGKLSMRQQMQAEAAESLNKFGAFLEYRSAVDFEILRLLRLVVSLMGGDPDKPRPDKKDSPKNGARK